MDEILPKSTTSSMSDNKAPTATTEQELLVATAEINKLHSVLRTMDNGVYGVDWDGKLSLFNDAAERITGWKKDEVLGRYCQEVMKVKDEKGSSVCANCPLAQSFSSRETVRISTCFVTNKAGEMIKVSSTYSPVTGEKNDLVSGIGVFRDLQKEEQFEKMKSDFVSMAAHELRTPLTSLKGYLSVLIDEGKNFTEEQRLFLDRSYISATRLESLTNNILSVARIERGSLPVNFSTFAIYDMLQEAIGMVNQKAMAKKITIEYKTKIDKSFTLSGDREKLKEVVLNYLNNAIVYTPENGWICIDVHQDNANTISVIVSDNGMGFESITKQHLFEKFFREHKEGTPVQGTGLGLYISKMIIETHHGKVWADSKGKNQGSTFGFEIPLKNP